jgi:hypothetical protein
MHVAIGPDGKGAVSWEGANEAYVDQAAAKLRPLVLNDDPVHAPTVLGRALGQLQDGEIKQQVAAIQKQWQTFNEVSYFSFGTTHEVGIRPDAGEMRTDRQIAMDYLYGSLIHHNAENRSRNRYVGDGAIRQAVALWVRDAILLTEATRRMILDLLEQGLIR